MVFPVHVGLVDIYDNDCNSSPFTMQALGLNGTQYDTGVPLDTVVPNEEGAFVYERMQLLGTPGSTARLLYRATRATAVALGQEELSVEADYAVLACPPAHSAAAEEACAACAASAYNFDGGACLACPGGGACMQYGGDGTHFQVLAGYYPSSFSAPRFLDACPRPASCPAYNCTIAAALDGSGGGGAWQVECGTCRPAAAEAAEEAGLDCLCAAGYTGRLCAACVFDEEACYYRSNGECHDASGLPLGLWGPAAELLCYVAVTVAWFSLRQDAESGLAKTLVFFVQTSAVLAGAVFLPYGLVDLLASMTSGMVLNWLSVASLRCASYTLFASQAVSMAVLVLMPLCLFLPLVVLVHAAKAAVRHQMRRRRAAHLDSGPGSDSALVPLVGSAAPSPAASPQSSPASSPSPSPPPSPREGRATAGGRELTWREELLEDSSHSALYILYASFFNVCNVLFSSWGCQKAQDGNWYSIAMPYLQCGAGEWLQLLVLSLVLGAVVVAAPVCLFAYLLRHFRARLDEEPVLARLGFLYESYRRDVYWWELVGLVRRLALALVVAMFGRGSALFATSVVAVLCACAAAQVQWTPFHTKRENMLELLAILLLLVSFQAGQFFDDRADLDSFSAWAVEVAVLLANGLFLVYLLFCVAKELRDEYRHKARRYYGRLRRFGSRMRVAASGLVGNIQSP